jgi:16S rRNA (adenine1518-N6/adenine1519-N6)-dimethyltransferase
VGRRFGQHFLARQSILELIAEAACGENCPLTVEIGPGRGALTQFLLERTERLIAIEVDPVLVEYLRQKFREAIDRGRLTLIEGDVLKADLGSWGTAVIAGNLPYYITSPILERVFATGNSWRRAVFLVQAEVAARLAAAPGTRDYGYLSVLVQSQARVEHLIEVPRAAFRPPPKVDSAVVRLEPLDPATAHGIVDTAAFLRFASVCFRHKRKTLRNNLVAAYPKDLVDQLPEGKKRAEQLGIQGLAELYGRISG